MFKKRFPFKLLISFIRVWSIQLDLISIHTHPARFAFSELKFSVVLHWHFVFYVSFVQRWISRSIHCVAEFGFVLSLAWRLSSLSLSSLLSEEAVDSLKATFGEPSFDKSENFSMRSARFQRFQFPNALLKHTHEKVGMFISSAFSNCLLPIRRDKYSAKNCLLCK